MLRFSANLSMLFGEYDFLARFEKAALNLCFLMTTTLKN